MSDKICCVCHVSVGDDAEKLGTRYYCRTHYDKVTKDRKGLWGSTAAAIVGLLVFVAVVDLVVAATKPALQGASLIGVGVVLALVPALLWLVVFYLQDRLEPEPKGYVLGIFVLGALLAQAVGLPVVRGLFHVQTWVGRGGWLIQLLASILIVGFVQEYLKYAAVRYTIFGSPEFDERVDGIIYGAAAGLGFATMLNIHYVVASGGVQLGVGIIRITVTALAQASFSGVMGYFLGRAKFENMGKWWLPAGLTLAAVLNGLVTYLLGEVSMRGLSFTPLYGLIVAAGVAVITFGVLFALIRRVNAMTLAEV